MKTLALGEVVDFYSGGTPSKSRPAFWQGHVPWFSAKDMKKPRLADSADHIADEVFDSTSLRKLPAGTIAMVVRGMILAHTVPISILDVDAAINQDLKALLPKREVDTSFLAAMLRAQHATILSQVGTAAHGTKKLETRVLEELRIPFPPLGEQRRIAAILDHADALRARRRQVLTHFDALTRSIFNDMFGSQSWPTEALGDRLQFLTSGSRGWAKYYAPAGDKFIRIQNVKGGYLNQRDMAYVVAPDTAEARRTAVQAGDVLLSITADLGRTAVVPNDIGTAYINQHLAILRAPSLNTRYLADFLESPGGQREVLGKDRGATKAGLNFDDVRSVSVPIPPTQVQACYAERVERITTHRRDALALQATLDELFLSIQSRAFQGEL